VENNFSLDDIVTKTPAPESQAVLSLANGYVLQLSDLMSTTTVRRVFLEDLKSIRVSIGEVTVSDSDDA
jgi:hypothetical protein